QCFSLEFFKGLEMLGQPLNDEQQEAWFHTWKAIGRIMGVQEELLRPTVSEAWDMQRAIYNHLFDEIDHASGVALAKALVGALSTFLLSTKFTLMLMKKMIFDDNHPDLFFQVLGPSFGQEYPGLFKKSRGDDGEDEETVEQYNKEFYEELVKHHDDVKDYREKQKLTEPVSRGEGNKNLVDLQLDVFEDVLKELDPENPNSRGLKDEIIKIAMNSVGGVIVGILAKYFRAGKQAGFRIPEDLKEHWAL
ncbi:MAG: oxygenase MpaB family protein, partial [Saprospiraceae bacterium]